MLGQPSIVLGLCGMALVAVGAKRSIAFPVAFASAPAIVIGLIGRNPLPHGAVALIVFVWTVLAISLTLARDDDALPLSGLMSVPVLLTVSLVALMLLRLGVSNDAHYGSFKLRLVVAENLTLLLAGIMIARRRRDFDFFVVLVLLAAAASAIVLTKELFTGQAQATVGGRFSLYQDQSPIGLARETATGLIVGVYLLLSERSTSLKLLALAVAPVTAVAFVAAGSRGPVLGLIVGLVVLLGLTLREPFARRRVLLVGIGAIVAAMLVSSLVPGQDITRSFSFLFGSGGGLSSNGRYKLWSEAWNAFAAHPFLGSGTGSFAQINPVELYPHNIALETAAELGFLGLLFVLGVVGSGAVRLLHTQRHGEPIERSHGALTSALFASAVVNASVSSDLAGNSFLWLTVGLAVGLSVRSLACAEDPAEADDGQRPAVLGLRNRAPAPL